MFKLFYAHIVSTLGFTTYPFRGLIRMGDSFTSGSQCNTIANMVLVSCYTFCTIIALNQHCNEETSWQNYANLVHKHIAHRPILHTLVYITIY